MTTPSATWWGHSTVALHLGADLVLTDPWLRRRVGPLARIGPMPPADLAGHVTLALVSHLHHDHLDLPSLRTIAAPVVVPRGAAALLPAATDVHEVEAGDELDVGGVHLTVVPASHDGDRLGYRGRAAPVGYLVRAAGRTVYFAGDTGPDPRLRTLRRGIDLALLPVGGWGLSLGRGHLGPATAAELAAVLAPRTAVPIHWGTLQLPVVRHLRRDLGRDAGRLFAERLAQLAPDVRAPVAAPGEPIALA